LPTARRSRAAILLHSSWLLEGKNEIHPMFLSFFIPVGSFYSWPQGDHLSIAR